MKRHQLVTFKPYQQDQMLLMPPRLDDMVPANHVVRVVNEAVEAVKGDRLVVGYKGGGSSSYHPKMMLKVLVYAYTQRIYTSRRIAKALRENVHFMWLSGMNRPDFRTINRFRGEILRRVMEPVFAMVLEMLMERGYVHFDECYVDGTKIEANAGRYSFVWKKAVKRYKARVQAKARELLDEAEEENAAEQAEYGDRDLEEVEGEAPSSQEIEERVRQLEEQLEQGSGSKATRKAVRTLRKDCVPRLRGYEEQERMLGGRNSCSKTDPEATFMRMKDATVAGAPLKAAYNVQIGTERQFVLSYSVHQRPGDPGCLIPHLEESFQRMGRRPQKLMADAAYGSEENYAYVNQHGIGNYLKYNHYDRDHRPRSRLDPYRAERWDYDEQADEYICPSGDRLTFRYRTQYVTENGYRSYRRIYVGDQCTKCSLHSQCTRRAGNRRVSISPTLQIWMVQAASNLGSPTGQKLRSRRPTEAESVFGHLKHNWSFRRFHLRGVEKVKTEWGLLCLAHNLSKAAAHTA